VHWIVHVIREGPGALIGAALGLGAGWLVLNSGIPKGCDLHFQFAAESFTYLCRSSMPPGVISASPLYLISAGGGVLGHFLYKKDWS